MSDKSKLNSFERALEAAFPSAAHGVKECVAEAFNAIEKHRARKIPLKQILETFNTTYGVKVSLPRFRQLLKAEHASREKSLAERFPKKVAES